RANDFCHSALLSVEALCFRDHSLKSFSLQTQRVSIRGVQLRKLPYDYFRDPADISSHLLCYGTEYTRIFGHLQEKKKTNLHVKLALI
ncbi:MAG: hypothetical protein RR822_04540, partial [Raoultibacter sp.]